MRLSSPPLVIASLLLTILFSAPHVVVGQVDSVTLSQATGVSLGDIVTDIQSAGDGRLFMAGVVGLAVSTLPTASIHEQRPPPFWICLKRLNSAVLKTATRA
jgi:hypothetical protein